MKFSVLPLLATSAHATSNIVQIAEATPDLSTLVTAVSAGGLVETLESPGPFTVFAPTNEAFSALPAGVVANLLKPENKKKLDDVLTYHVVSGAVHAKDLSDGEIIQTVEGGQVKATVNTTGVFINDAQVTTANVDASNGVVHIIDGVLLPTHTPTPPGPSTAGLQLVTFDGQNPSTTFEWEAVNDPVMGGRSNSTFAIEGGQGVFDGEVRIVPSLGAAGFCNAETRGTQAHFADASAYSGLSFRVRNTGALTGLQLTVMTRDSGGLLRHGEYSGALTVPADGAYHDVAVAYADFKCEWRGQKIQCPEMATEMGKIEKLGMSFGQAPNVPGKFHIEIESISAVKM